MNIDANVTEHVLPAGYDSRPAYAFAGHLARQGHGGDVVEAALLTAFDADALSSQRVHNLMTDDGLAAIAYNCTASNGSAVAYFLVGDGTAAPSASDTALSNQVASYEDAWQVVARNHHLIGYHLTGHKRDDANGETINEIGLKTGDSGNATASDDKLVARAVLYGGDRHAITTGVDVIYTWSLAYAWGSERPYDSPVATFARFGTDYGLNFIATKLADLTTYGTLSHVAVGGSVSGEPNAWEDKLTNEQTRTIATYTPSGASITVSITVSIGTISGYIEEWGPAVGSTTDEGVVFVLANVFNPPDNATAAVDIDITITFYNRYAVVGHAKASAVSTSVTITASAANGLSAMRHGDTAIFFVACGVSGVTLGAPSTGGTWTKILSETGVGAQEVAAWSFVQAGDTAPASHVFTTTSSGRLTAMGIAFRNIDSVGTLGTVVTNTNSIAVPAVELGSPGVALLAVFQNQDQNFAGDDDYNIEEERNVFISALLGWRALGLGTVPGVTITTDGFSVSAVGIAVPLNRDDLDEL